MAQVSRMVPAPEGLGVALARVPEGSDVRLDLRLESVLEGVLVTGTAEFEVVGECARCLEPVDYDEEAEFTELFAYPATDARGREVEEPGEDDPPSRIEGDLIDLEPVLRDAVVLRLPIAPLCRDDCRGLCPDCGEPLGDGPAHVHEQLDPRWAALAGLREESSDSEEIDREEGS